MILSQEGERGIEEPARPAAEALGLLVDPAVATYTLHIRTAASASVAPAVGTEPCEQLMWSWLMVCALGNLPLGGVAEPGCVPGLSSVLRAWVWPRHHVLKQARRPVGTEVLWE